MTAAALLLAAQLLQRREPGINGWVTGVLIAAVLGGRLGHVIQYPALYADAPWQALYIWQDGYTLWGAVVAMGLITAGFVLFRGLALRWLSAAVAPALVVALVGWVVVHNLQPEPLELAEAETVFTLEGEATSLQAESAGQASGVFLWASWCGVCRQMMPDLIDAAREQPESQWLLVNVGEQPEEVHAYLAEHENDWPSNVTVVLDPKQQLMRDWRAYGVPTTLLFDAEGVQVDRFMGRRSVSRLLGSF
nr:TlpA disulfide reductase family protein [Natronospira proteinivora]